MLVLTPGFILVGSFFFFWFDFVVNWRFCLDRSRDRLGIVAFILGAASLVASKTHISLKAN